MKLYKVLFNNKSIVHHPLWKVHYHTTIKNLPQYGISKLFAYRTEEEARRSFSPKNPGFSLWECEAPDAIRIYSEPSFVDHWLPFWSGIEVPNQLPCPPGTVVTSWLILRRRIPVVYTPPPPEPLVVAVARTVNDRLKSIFGINL